MMEQTPTSLYRMKVFYLANIGHLSSVGVLHKIAKKVQGLAATGIQVKGAIFYNRADGIQVADFQNELLDLVAVPEGKSLYYAIDSYFESNPLENDVALFRYPLASQELLAFVKKYPNKIVFEHNTKELEELLIRIRSYIFRDYLYMLRKFDFSPIISDIQLYREEKKWGPEIFSHAKGGIAVTAEIATYESQRKSGYRTKVVSNGIEVDEIHLLERSNFDPNGIKLIMLSASANSWHGVDRLLKGITNYKGTKKITLYLVGNFTSAVRKLAEGIAKHKIVFTGLLKKDEINTISKEVDLGIGTLALHRIPLMQGCVLKSREYLAMGLPFIYGYEDVDFMSNKMANYAFRIPADESPVNMEEVIAFRDQVYAIPDLKSKMREQAFQLVDMRVKMKQVKDILEEFMGK